MRIKMARSLRKESKSVTLDYAAVNDEVAKSAKLQENSFPRIVRRGLALYISCAPFLLAHATIQLRALFLPPHFVLHPNDDPNEVKTLYNGCVENTNVDRDSHKHVTVQLHVKTTILQCLNIAEMDALRKVHITDGPLEMLPENIGTKLYRLQKKLDFNRLQMLPKSLGNANILHICLQVLTSLESSIDTLDGSSMTWFDLSSNDIDEILNLEMANLQALFMSNNSLKIPKFIYKSSLTQLDIDGNNISSLPSEIQFRSGLLLHLAK